MSRGKRYRRIPEARRRRIHELTKHGYTVGEIVKLTGVSKRSVERIRSGLRDLTEVPANERLNPKAAEDWLEENPPARTRVLDLYPTQDQRDRAARGEMSRAEAVKLALTVPAIRALYDFEFWCERYESQKLYACQRRWFAHACLHSFAEIIGPPRHGKTQLFSVFVPSWLACGGGRRREYYFDPFAVLRNVRIMKVAKSEDQARKDFLAVAQRLTMNRKLIADYGRFRSINLPWSESKGAAIFEGAPIDTASGDYSFVVIGVKSAVLGRGADVILVDDPSDTKNCKTIDQVEEQLRWIRTEVFTRLEPEATVGFSDDGDGWCIVTGARLPLPTDLYEQISKLTELEDSEADEAEDEESTERRVFAVLVDQAIHPDTGDLLCPERWTKNKLLRRRSLLGPDVFEAVYQQNPGGGSWKLCQRDWIYGGGTDPMTGDPHPGCLDHNRAWGQARRARDGDGNPLPYVRVLSIDPSPTKFYGCLVYDICQSREDYSPEILDIHRARMSLPDAIRLMNEWHDVYKYNVLIFENNVEKSIKDFPDFQDFIDRTGVDVLWHKTADNKNHPNYGKQTIAGDIAAGRVRIPWGNADTRMKFRVLVNELLEDVSTDDLVMATWFGKWNLPGLQIFGGSVGIDRVLGRGQGWAGPPAAAFSPPPRLTQETTHAS